MFSLFYGLWKYLVSKTEFHVLILGIDKDGKTIIISLLFHYCILLCNLCIWFVTLLEKLKTQYSNLEGLPPDRIVPTVGVNIVRIETLNTKPFGLRSIWEKYYEEENVVIFVVDASCPSRFEDFKFVIEKLLMHEDLQGALLIILANKQDLVDAVSIEELVQYLDLKKLDERAYTFEVASGYDG
uniref:Uncharacterized protein n=1 Tax=Lactuca sativa TaxID=4236 RepID=A0A9R1V8G9_LACSA|nr:hypothetical protein LSAT_V11C600311120 [Lactuca sativa]